MLPVETSESARTVHRLARSAAWAFEAPQLDGATNEVGVSAKRLQSTLLDHFTFPMSRLGSGWSI